MIDGELTPAATVLTFSFVPSEKIGTIEHYTPERNVFILIERDDSRIIETLIDRSDFDKFVARNEISFVQ